MKEVDVPLGDEWIERIVPVLAQLRRGMSLEAFVGIYEEAWPQGLRYTAIFDESSACLAVAGWRVMTTTFAGRKVYVDDLVTDQSRRSHGLGAQLLRAAEARGRAVGCKVIDLDSGVERYAAHRFYLRERFAIASHHFGKRL